MKIFHEFFFPLVLSPFLRRRCRYQTFMAQHPVKAGFKLSFSLHRHQIVISNFPYE
jgi:hypothetical protein